MGREIQTAFTKSQLLVHSWCESAGFRSKLEELISGYSLDIYLPELKLGIELDGPYHRKRRDAKRDGHIKRRYGIDIWRFKNKDIDKMDSDEFIEMLNQRVSEIYED